MTCMILRYFPFKIILPLLYLLLTALFVGGIIFTIAEGPNPFGFLFHVAVYPAAFLDLLLPRSSLWSQVNGWRLFLLGVLLNLLIYVLVGFLIYYLIRRRPSVSPVARR